MFLISKFVGCQVRGDTGPSAESTGKEPEPIQELAWRPRTGTVACA